MTDTYVQQVLEPYGWTDAFGNGGVHKQLIPEIQALKGTAGVCVYGITSRTKSRVLL